MRALLATLHWLLTHSLLYISLNKPCLHDLQSGPMPRPLHQQQRAEQPLLSNGGCRKTSSMCWCLWRHGRDHSLKAVSQHNFKRQCCQHLASMQARHKPARIKWS